MWIYTILEVLIVIFHFTKLIPIINLFDYLPFIDVRLDFNYARISSISFEPPFLAIYLITISGWMYSYIITDKGITKFLPALSVLVMAFLSGSRTMLVVMIIQLIVFLMLLFRLAQYRKFFIYFVAICGSLFLLTILISGGSVLTSISKKIETLNFTENLTKSISNKSRFGMQYANFQVFKDNPIIGVGFGQQAYHNREYYPEWATKDNYEFELWYLNENEKSFPPGYNLYIRILAETGIIGFSFFILFIFVTLYQLNRVISNSTESERVIAIILFISFVGFYINWLQVDTFRIFGFWICLSILYTLMMYRYRTKKQINR